MALTDIIFYDVSVESNRGNVGLVTDTVVETATLFTTIPAVNDVELGVVYGPQDSQTGTLEGGGGGPTYYAYG